MSKEKTVKNSFKDFAQQNGEYYSKVFSLIQRNQLKLYHINYSALLGGFFWCALRGNWFLFFLSSFLDLIAAVNITLYFRYGAGIEQAILDKKDFLYIENELKRIIESSDLKAFKKLRKNK